jgi:hypothetical protein
MTLLTVRVAFRGGSNPQVSETFCVQRGSRWGRLGLSHNGAGSRTYFEHLNRGGEVHLGRDATIASDHLLAMTRLPQKLLGQAGGRGTTRLLPSWNCFVRDPTPGAQWQFESNRWRATLETAWDSYRLRCNSDEAMG